MRGEGAVVTVRRLRRSICALGRKTHVLVPEDTLSRRRDTAEVIGFCLLSKTGGAGRRSIAIALGRHESTVAGWLRRFRANAVRIREHFWHWAEVIASGYGSFSPSGSAFSDAVEAIGVVGQVAVRRFGPRPPWSLASVLTGGALLATRAHPYPEVVPNFVGFGGGPPPDSCHLVGVRASNQRHRRKGTTTNVQEKGTSRRRDAS